MGIKNCADLGLNFQKIVKRLLANQTLCKLLYFSDKDPLSHPNISDTKVLLDDYITPIPRTGPNDVERNKIVLTINNGILNTNNESFRDFSITISLYTPFTQWIIKSDSLRPFLLMGEIQNSLNSKEINGLGKLTGGNFTLTMLTDSCSRYDVKFRLTDFD